ncbi:hypothetical protein ACSLGG_30350 (plasmid) [Bacillus mycoides]|uniref:hypothetical protein n=1 Tax=Bacillus mycoides TaxID=1405 RepID=UPI003F755CAA
MNELFETFKFGSFFEIMKVHIQDNPQFISDFRRIASEDDITLVDFFTESTEEPVLQEE